FFFSALLPTSIYSLSLHDALPIFSALRHLQRDQAAALLVAHLVLGDRLDAPAVDPVADLHLLVFAVRLPDQRITLGRRAVDADQDRKSTRLNSSHVKISYAVFCLK